MNLSPKFFSHFNRSSKLRFAAKTVCGLLLAPSLLQAQNLVFQEANGLLIMEAESITTPAPWAKRTAADIPANDPEKLNGFTGSGFIEWTGQQYFGLTTTNPDTPIRYNFQITNPGTYKLVWRTKQKNAGQTFDAGNDAFVRFATGSIPTGGRNFGIFTKIYVQNKDNWEVSANAEPGGNPKFVFNNFSRVLDAGTHAVEISGRSPGHVIDRIILHRTDVPFNPGQFATAPESEAIDGGEIIIDSVSGALLPTSIDEANSFTVDIPYTATTSRDVNVAIIQPGGTPSWRGAGRTTVSAGSGTASVTINITNPNTNALVPGSYQWVASIREVGQGYQTNKDEIRNNFSVTAIVTEYSQWQSSNFLPAELSNPAISGNDADPGGNGLPNIVDYALGIDPKGSLKPELKMSDVSPTEVMVSYDRKSGDRAGVSIRLLHSSNLAESSWQNINNDSTQVSPGTNGMEEAMHTVPRLQDADKQFYRLHFEY